VTTGYRPINHRGTYTLRRNESGKLIIPTGDEEKAERKTFRARRARRVHAAPAVPVPVPVPVQSTQPRWRQPPNFANWIGGWLRCLGVAKPDEWLADKIGEVHSPAKPFHVLSWLKGLTLPSPYRFLQTCKVIALMSGKPLSDTITEAAEACYRSTGSGYETSIGFSDDSLIDLS